MRMPDEELRDRLLSTLDLVPAPPSRLDHVVRRARILRLRRWLGWTAAGSLVLIGLAIPLLVLLPLAQSPEQGDDRIQPADTQSQVLDVGGIQLVVPEGWDARDYAISGYPWLVVRAATFALPESDDILASAARQSMGPNDVLITLVEYVNCPCPVLDDLPSLPLSLEAEDFQTPFANSTRDDVPPQQGDVPETHAFARRHFEFKLGGRESRFFDLWAEFGQNPAPEAAISDVNDLLASMVIGKWEPRPQPDGVCNDQITNDPDCPWTIWLKAVLTRAGFEAVAPGEQTLVGRGGEATFFIYSRPATPLEDNGWPVHSVVDRITVYEGAGPPGTLAWTAQGLDVFISPGPTGGDTIPGQEGMEALVRATLRVSYPPQE